MPSGFCNIPYIPVRKSPSDREEMITMILFGEAFEILTQGVNNWHYIQTHSDSYKGWIFDRNIEALIANENFTVRNEHLVSSPFAEIRSMDSVLYLGFGSRIVNLQQNQHFELLNKKYLISEDLLPVDEHRSFDQVVSLILKLSGTPYLWGGKSSYGFDCSGFVQTVFRLVNHKLPRDAYEQEMMGKTIKDIETTKAGDLAFFKDIKGKINHVGIIIEPGKIIHASQYVRVSKIDNKGILKDNQRGRYSHELASIKRIL